MSKNLLLTWNIALKAYIQPETYQIGYTAKLYFSILVHEGASFVNIENSNTTMVGNNSTAIIGNAGKADNDDDSQNDTSADDINSDAEGDTYILKSDDANVDIDAQNE